MLCCEGGKGEGEWRGAEGGCVMGLCRCRHISASIRAIHCFD